MSYELYNHTTVRPFKGDKLMRNEYCDENYYGKPMSLITLRCDEIKLSPFKGDELMRNEYCDGFHYGNPMS